LKREKGEKGRGKKKFGTVIPWVRVRKGGGGRRGEKSNSLRKEGEGGRLAVYLRSANKKSKRKREGKKGKPVWKTWALIPTLGRKKKKRGEKKKGGGRATPTSRNRKIRG